MKITPEILNALERAINDSGSIYKLAKELGISHSTIFFWRTGRTTNINRQMWNSCLRKKLKPYLAAPAYPSEITEDKESARFVREPRIVYGAKPSVYPVVYCRKLVHFDPRVRATASFVQEYSTGQFHFVALAGVTAFALRIDESVQNDILIQGSTLLVETGRPPVNGELVIVRGKGEDDISFYTFHAEETSYRLVPYGRKDKEEIRWDNTTSSTELLDWIYPVLEANIMFCK